MLQRRDKTNARLKAQTSAVRMCSSRARLRALRSPRGHTHPAMQTLLCGCQRLLRHLTFVCARGEVPEGEGQAPAAHFCSHNAPAARWIARKRSLARYSRQAMLYPWAKKFRCLKNRLRMRRRWWRAAEKAAPQGDAAARTRRGGTSLDTARDRAATARARRPPPPTTLLPYSSSNTTRNSGFLLVEASCHYGRVE